VDRDQSRVNLINNLGDSALRRFGLGLAMPFTTIQRRALVAVVGSQTRSGVETSATQSASYVTALVSAGLPKAHSP
jgi:hypothetical protein